MANWRRHAIYFAPPAGSALERFGADWLGWDTVNGRSVSVPPERATLVAASSRYGFHATLKPPFRLAEGCDAAALDAAASALAADCAAFALSLRPDWLGGFLALVPDAPAPAMDALAARCVTELDAFRAPPDAADLARRRAAGLDAVGEAHLRRWGYPYVLDRFRFHMTLTGPVRAADRAETAERLRPWLPLLAAPLPVAEICRFAEDPDGRFHLLARHSLS